MKQTLHRYILLLVGGTGTKLRKKKYVWANSIDHQTSKFMMACHKDNKNKTCSLFTDKNHIQTMPMWKFQGNTMHFWLISPRLVSPKNSQKTSQRLSVRARYGCLSEFEVWAKFHLSHWGTVFNIMLYWTKIYREFIVLGPLYSTNPCLFMACSLC